MYPLFRKLPGSTAKGALAPTFTQTPSWPFSHTSIIFSACRDHELNRQILGLPRISQEHSRVKVCAKPYTPLFGKLLRSTAKGALPPTFTPTPSWLFSGSLTIHFGLQGPWTNWPKRWFAKKSKGTQSCEFFRKATKHGQRCPCANLYTNNFLDIFWHFNHIFGFQRP